MRKTSQSMYQSTLKVPMTASKLIDGSSLFKSSGAIPRTNFIYIAGSAKKIEGRDLIQSTKGKKSFEQTVNHLKNKPNQKVVEEEYIGGLQEEIKYLEYELKLLKDKELIEREGVNELDNFLKDEIPINENILAMKNKYNSTKTTLEEKYRELGKKINEANEVLSVQKDEIARYHKCIEAHRKQSSDRKDEFKSKLFELIKELTLTKDEQEYLSVSNKEKQENIKKMSEEIATLQRKGEKEKIQEVREEENKEKTKEKFLENFRVTKDDLVEALQKIDELEAHEDTNPLLEALEQENSNLRKKIILNEKQKSTADNLIAEIDLLLSEESKEREAERQQKSKLTAQSEVYRFEIQYLERFVENLIKDQTNRYKNKLMKEMKINLEEKTESYELLVDRLRSLEQDCSNMIEERKELTDRLQMEREKSNEMEEVILEKQNKTSDCRSKTDAFTRLTAEITNEIGPIRNELESCKRRAPLVEKEIEKKNVMLNHLNKQIDLLKELKTIDLQQLQMISEGGSNVQNTLHSFIKNWEKIKSL